MFDEKTKDYILISILAMTIFIFLVIPKNQTAKSLMSKAKRDTKEEETETVTI